MSPETVKKPKASFLSKPFSFVKSVILPVGLSILANGIFALIFLGGWLSGATLNTTAFALLLFGVFLVGFPFAYFWLAKKQAVLKGVSWLYYGSSDYINQGVSWLVAASVKGKNASVMGIDVNSAINSIDDYLPNALKLPLKFVLDKLPLYDFIEEVGSDLDLTSDNLPQVQLQVQQKVNRYVEGELLGASSFWMWGLIVVNVAAMVLAWRFFV